MRECQFAPSIEAHRACCDGNFDFQLRTCLYFSVHTVFCVLNGGMTFVCSLFAPYCLESGQVVSHLGHCREVSTPLWTGPQESWVSALLLLYPHGPMLPVSRLFHRAEVNVDLHQVFVVGYTYKVTDE